MRSRQNEVQMVSPATVPPPATVTVGYPGELWPWETGDPGWSGQLPESQEP